MQAMTAALFIEELFDVPAAEAEDDGLLEMRGGGLPLLQGLIRAGNIVMTGGVEIVRRNGCRKRLDREPVTAGSLIDEPENVEIGGVCGSTSLKALTDDFGSGELALLVGQSRFGDEVGHLGRRRNPAPLWRAQMQPGVLFCSYQSRIDDAIARIRPGVSGETIPAPRLTAATNDASVGIGA